MRFHLSTAPQNTTWETLLDVWRAADDTPLFEAGWTFDHFYPIFSDPTGDCMDGWITLTALLNRTGRLRGGVLVTGMLYRHPAVLANMAAAVDITSGGRLELGLGAGWNEEECDAYGIELGTLTERFDRFDEGLQIICGLLTQEHTTVHGKHYRVTGAMNSPKAVQSPHPPICIGGTGQKRTLPLVARYAQHWNYGTLEPSVEEFRRLRGVLDDACARIGRDPAEIESSVIVRPDRGMEAMAESAAAFAEAGADIAIVSTGGRGPELVGAAAEALTAVP